MPSREEFMRQLGISNDDVKDPGVIKTKIPSKSSSSVNAVVSPARMEAVDAAVVKKRGYQSYSEELREAPVAPMAKPVAETRAAPSRNAREDFLRSLGIDNMDQPPPQATASRTSASQERSTEAPRASQEYATKQARPAAVCSHDSTNSGDDGPGPRSFMAQPAPDITLGMRKASSTFKSNAASSSSYARHTVDDSSSSSQLGGASSMVDRELEGLTVEEIKAMGNACFEAGDYRKSIRLYTRALERDPRNAALYSNRSACYLQAAKQMGIDTRLMAHRDADKVIELRPDWFKGYSRKGDALFKLERYSEAAIAYERGLALDPTNTNLMHSFGEAKNAAGGVKQTRSASWNTQPQASETLRKAQGKSAHDLMEEMRESLRKEASECVAIGNDYRQQELQRFREHAPLKKAVREGANNSSGSREASSGSSYRQHLDDDDDDGSRATSSVGNGPGTKLDAVRDDETFGSRAAAAYQQKILEDYRRKKQSQSASSFTH